jgi:hypothetical protein
MSINKKTTVSASFGVLVGLVVLTPLFLFFHDTASPPQRQPGQQSFDMGALVQPISVCGGPATEWTISQAAATEPYRVLVPDDVLADVSSMTHIWKCGGTGIVEQFSSGINISQAVNVISNPAASWAALAAADPTTTSVGTVRGQPAALIDPDKDPTHQSDGSVTVVDAGVYMLIVGNGKIPITDLERVTNSLQPTS